MPFGRRGTCILPFKTTESDMIGVIRGDALHFEALASNPRGAQTMVCAAAAQGWNGAIGVMLNEYSDYFTADGADVKNYTPLGRAAMNGRVSTIELLIDEYGAGVDVPNNAGPSFLGGGGWFDGDTALELALGRDHVEACRALLRRDAEDPTGEAAQLVARWDDYSN
jgi:hypothetical protein